MKRALLLFALLPLVASAQSARLDVRIEVERDGLYEISHARLAPFLPRTEIRAENFVMRRDGVEVPLHFTGLVAGRFGRNSSIVFYGEHDASEYSRIGVYRLKLGRGTARVREVSGPPRGDVSEVMVKTRFEEELVFDPWKTIRSKILDIPHAERSFWFWKRIPPPRENAEAPDNVATFALEVSPRAHDVRGAAARLSVHLRSHLAKKGQQSMRIELAGRAVGDFEWTGSGMQTIDAPIPTEQLKGLSLVVLRNTSARPVWREPANQVNQAFSNDILIDAMELTYPTILTGPTKTAPHLIYDVQAEGEDRDLHFRSFRSEAFQIYDVGRRTIHRNGRAHLAANRGARYVVCGFDGYLTPKAIETWSRRNILDEREGGDWVVVTLDRLKDSVAPLAELRKSQGLKPYVVTSREIYDAFSAGRFSPDAIRHFMQWACKSWKTKPRYLLLVGDADRSVDWASTKETLPTALVDTYYNGATASDAALVAGCTNPISVGRLPMRSATDVLVFVRKLIRYETEPAAGDWRKRLNFIASEGRFGPMIDGLIEQYAVGMLTNAIPAHFDVTMTYASPTSRFLFPPNRFNEQAIGRFNEGSLIYSYIGHGYARGFDALRVGDRRYPILGLDHLKFIDAGEKNPVVSIIACSTAHFDDPEVDCIAEEMLDLQGGPVAIIGATRISHPLPNTLLGEHLMREIFGGGRMVGDALRKAADKTVESWNSPVAQMASMMLRAVDRRRLMKEHRDLYVLLGDPATQIALPTDTITLEVDEKAAFGTSLAVAGKIEGLDDGEVRVTIEARRDRIVHPTKAIDLSNTTEQEILANYRAANDKVIAGAVVTVEQGAFSTTIDLPSGFPAGAYVVKAFAAKESMPFVGSKALELNMPAAPEQP